MWRRISTSSRPEAPRGWRRVQSGEGNRRRRTATGRLAGSLETAAKLRDPETPARIAGPRVLARIRNREATHEAIQIGVRRQDPVTQPGQCRLATAGTATVVAGRDFRRCPRARLPGPGRVNQPDAHPWEAQIRTDRPAARTDRHAVRVQQAAAIAQKAGATADRLVRSS